jgi:alpha-L-arabinofuranosidase
MSITFISQIYFIVNVPIRVWTIKLVEKGNGESMTEKNVLKIFTKETKEEMGDLFGIFFEDINHAADGGLYAELVQNRSFEFNTIDNKDYHGLTAWEKVERGNAKVEINVEDSYPLNEMNTNYLTLSIIEPGEGAGIMNLGFNTGIPVKSGENYHFSCYARCDTDSTKPVTVTLESTEGRIYAKNEVTISSTNWKKYEIILTAVETDYSSRLVLTTKEQGKLYLDMISLFPEKTFKDRPNGMREDIAQILADLKPKFMRFPGGCLVHDGSLNPDDRDSMYRWKNTIGNVEKRPARRSNWSYNQTLGLGYYEYFLFCEDIGAKPIPVLPAGYDPHHQRMVPIEELQPWIDDALDLIEFANGDTSTVWGAKRAELGHPEPFGLEYLGIGNEEVGEPFFERYEYFHKAIKEKHPTIKIINSSGPFAAGSEYDRGWKSARENKSDFVDEHYYSSPEWFLANYHRYDEFKKDDPKVFLGEYASWGNTYYNALVEGAFMTGLENNAHAVGLACYAPLLCNVDYVNWKPDLIWFNNHSVYGTPNYYVQKLFMHHQGDYTLNIESKGWISNINSFNKPITGKIILGDGHASAQYYNIKLINKDTGEKRNYKDCYLDEGQNFALEHIEWENYQLSLNAKKSGGTRGFKIFFGNIDDKNSLFWEIGGWQNLDSILCSDVNGRNSCLTQSLFTVETNREYHLELDVTGRHIRACIDGSLINETEDKLPMIEPLYYSASLESSTGDVIVKVVNVQERPVTVQIELENMEKESITGSIFEMSGYELSDENSFETPNKIVPKQKEITISRNTLDYQFPKESITVMRFHKAGLQDNRNVSMKECK